MRKVGIPKASEVKGALAPGLAAVIAHDCLTIWRNDRDREWKWFGAKVICDLLEKAVEEKQEAEDFINATYYEDNERF